VLHENIPRTAGLEYASILLICLAAGAGVPQAHSMAASIDPTLGISCASATLGRHLGWQAGSLRPAWGLYSSCWCSISCTGPP